MSYRINLLLLLVFHHLFTSPGILVCRDAYESTRRPRLAFPSHFVVGAKVQSSTVTDSGLFLACTV